MRTNHLVQQLKHLLPCGPSRALVSMVLLCFLVTPGAWSRDGKDHDRARNAVASGQVLALPLVLERIAKEQPGQVIEVELEQDDGMWIYELKILQSGGQLIKVKADAGTGAIIRMKSDGRPPRSRQGKPD